MINFILHKKPIIIVIGFLFLIEIVNAQNLAYTKLLLSNNELARAKESIDSISNNSTSVEVLLLKANIYNAICKDAGAKYLVTDGKLDAFISIKKAYSLDKKFVFNYLKENNFKLLHDLYNGYTTEGLLMYNIGIERKDKTNFNDALTKFKNAGQIGQFLFENNWRPNALDTNNLIYSVQSALNADIEFDILFFCKKIVDNEIVKAKNGTSMETAYKWLVFYYKEKKEGELLDKYYTKASKLFPQSIYYNLLMIDWRRESKEYDKMFTLYDVLLSNQFNTSSVFYQLAYASDLFNYCYGDNDIETGKRIVYEAKLLKNLQNYNTANATSNDGKLLLAKHYINQANNVAKEMMLRTTTNRKILESYKISQKNYLLKSNLLLKQIIEKVKIESNNKIFQEAVQLLITNFNLLNLTNEAKKYKELLERE